MSLERFINKELTHAAERTTARFITGFEDDVVVYHAFELIQWDDVPGTKGTTGKFVESMVKPDTQEGLALVRQRFTEHALARI
mgnify:FL=1